MCKRILKFLLSVAVVITVVFIAPTSFITEVSAIENDYPMACGTDYEVSTINADGSFNKLSCHSDFYSAKAAMQTAGNDAVVRHHASYSPTGIIAMNSGIALSYPARNGSKTLTIKAHLDGSGKSTYVEQHREMTTAITETYDGNGNGKVFVQLNGFQGYADLKQLDLVPMKYITNNIAILLGGKDTTASAEKPFWNTVKQAYYTVVQNGNYRDLVYHAYSGYNSSTNWKMIIGKAADWMSTGAIYYSWDGYRFYNDREFTSIAGIYYNYYQFLPVRSKTNITADDFNKYLSTLGFTSKPASTDFEQLGRKESQLWNEGQTFIDAQNTYGINALLIFSMACHESGNGRSRYAIERNNLFGWNAFDSNPDSATTFYNIPQAIQEHMGINIRGYADITDARFFGSHVGNKGSGFNVKYASDPYWGMKIASVAYAIDKCANNYSGALSDHDIYSLGIITEYNASVKQAASSSSKTLYTTTYGNQYQENFTVVIRTQNDEWTEIQSTNGILENGALLTHRTDGSSTGSNLNGLIPYDFDRSIGYLKTSQLENINGNLAARPEGTVPNGDFISSLSSIEFIDGKLSLQGTAYRPGIHVNDSNKISHTLSIYDEFYDSVDYPLTTELEGKDKATFSVDQLDLSALTNGIYYFKIETQYSGLPDYNEGFYPVIETEIKDSVFNKKIYSFKIEDETLYLTVKDAPVVEPTPTPTPEISPSPTPSTTPSEKPLVEHSIRQSLTKMEYEGTELKMAGMAFISGLDAIEESKIEHKIILKKMETDEETVLMANTLMVDEPVNIFDGYVYQKINFDLSLDVAELDEGNYRVILSVTNKDIELQSPLYSIKESLIPEVIEKEGNLIKVFQNPTYNYRYEISVEKNGFNTADMISKPTRRDSMFSFDSIKFNDDQLLINGMAWIQNVSFDDKANTTHQLYLMNNEGKTTAIETITKACTIDYSTIMGSKYSMKNICFESTINLDELEETEYRLYMDLSTTDYRDIYELTYHRNLSIEPHISQNRIHTLFVSKVRDRLSLTISE